MSPEEIEETLKKMALVLEAIVNKIDELEQKIIRIEEEIKLRDNAQLSEQMNKEKAKYIYGETQKTLKEAFNGLSVYDSIMESDTKAKDMAERVGINDTTLNNLSDKIDSLSEKVESSSWLNSVLNKMESNK